MNDRANNKCTLGAETGPIIVRQIVGEKEKQKALDIHVVVPERKPSIEQIVDVFVKEVEVNSVDVITDKVIVRGEFEIKAIYVASLPDQPVHAVEIRHYKWTLDIDIPGARRGMDAEASVVVEFVDYDVEDHHRAYKYKNFDPIDCSDDDDDCDHDHHHDDDCEDHDHHHDDDCDDHDHHHHHHRNCREFDVSVILKVTAKVMTDREVTLGIGTLPTKPKG
ncbi:DUF3794 domain-containing protein [Sporomusa acidovorans]|uniref:SipL SPOCS domain-containing protein n=1 Tax=Sporomusa acidovorans (strain ATCC 49682 / DSM 3132 / Mol) TaxID=1123286 RepID=A0ABZ3IW31_SPOA4|nr:DUF3794 domain-containing protein [Sporomusa acidovorans]OZC14015.1 hypothetical protein SPACI_54470 [Sporomusa acidovorans DSM 3132]SDF22418.1 protein of unknown function [Sporomusa acidovorans]